MAITLSLCTSGVVQALSKCCSCCSNARHGIQSTSFRHSLTFQRNRGQLQRLSFRRFRVIAKTESSKKSSSSEEKIPSWAQPDSDEPPPWARNEGSNQSPQSLEVPFYVYLLASAITAIAAIGSIFEYANKNPVFGVVNSDSIFYTPLLGFFAFTGIPTSAFLWFKSVQAANKESEEQDRRDGFL